MDKAKLEELKARVEGLSGPDRMADALLFQHADPKCPAGAVHMADPSHDVGDFTMGHYGAYTFAHAPSYTFSIDAALALVKRVLPGWFWRAGRVPGPHWENGVLTEAWCHLSRMDASNALPGDEHTGWAHTVPAAIILALLSALIEKDTTNAG